MFCNVLICLYNEKLWNQIHQLIASLNCLILLWYISDLLLANLKYMIHHVTQQISKNIFLLPKTFFSFSDIWSHYVVLAVLELTMLDTLGWQYSYLWNFNISHNWNSVSLDQHFLLGYTNTPATHSTLHYSSLHSVSERSLWMPQMREYT